MSHTAHDSARASAVQLPDEAATLALGNALAGALADGLVIYLCGDLGAGKTTLVRGLLRTLGYTGIVRSPTYTLVELYAISNLHLYHFDFYRFSQPEEYLDTGLDEYFQGHAVCLVEWPERAAPYVPRADVRITLTIADRGRRAEIAALSTVGEQCLDNLEPRLNDLKAAPA